MELLDKNYLRAKEIKLLILDVDGVLTDGGIYFANNGEEAKRFNTLDGHGLRILQQAGINIAVISAKKSELVNKRMQGLGVSLIYQGQQDKLKALAHIKDKLGLDNKQIAYVGDDMRDLPVMTKIGFAVAVDNAHDSVKEHSNFITKKVGGSGAVREVCDYILKAQGKYDDIIAGYLK